MTKVALFVEGQTERQFAQRYVAEVVGYNNMNLVVEAPSGRSYTQIFATTQDDAQHYVLIVDCGSDERVLTAIRDRYSDLSKAGFACIVGLRDLYPHPVGDRGTVEEAIAQNLPTGGSQVHIVLAIMEIESWFIQDDQHYTRVDQGLTADAVSHLLQLDLHQDSAETLPHPAVSLNRAYGIVGKRYTKKKGSTLRTVEALDIENLYLNKRTLLPSFERFAAIVEGCLGL